jgi:hypothetical protein
MLVHKQLMCQRDPVGITITYVQAFLDSFMLPDGAPSYGLKHVAEVVLFNVILSKNIVF